MPVRIYDISKKLGLENKDVLTKAKELGIAAARVASSSLDKITAEYLEEKLRVAFPNAGAPLAPATPPAQAAPQQAITIVSEPAPPPQSETVTAEPPPSVDVAVAEAPPGPVAIAPPQPVHRW